MSLYLIHQETEKTQQKTTNSWCLDTTRLQVLYFLHPEKSPASKGQVHFPLRVLRCFSIIHMGLNNACCWLSKLPDQSIQHLMVIHHGQQTKHRPLVQHIYKILIFMLIIYHFPSEKHFARCTWKHITFLIWLKRMCQGHWSRSEYIQQTRGPVYCSHVCTFIYLCKVYLCGYTVSIGNSLH